MYLLYKISVEKSNREEKIIFNKKQIKKIIINNLDVFCDWSKGDIRYWDSVFKKLRLKNC